MLWQDSSFGRVGGCLNLVERKWSVLGVSGSTLKVENKFMSHVERDDMQAGGSYFIYRYIKLSRVESNI